LHTTLAELPQAAQQLGGGPAIVLLGAAFARADAVTITVDSPAPAQAASA